MSALLQQYSTLQTQLQQLTLSDTEIQFLSDLYQLSGSLAMKFSEYGDAAYNELINNPQKATAQSFLIAFEWGEPAKAFLLLIRASIFEYQKALLLCKENRISVEKLHHLRSRTMEVILNANAELMGIIHQFDISGRDRITQQKIKKWKLQKAPWPTYKEQLEAIENQCIRLKSEYAQMFDNLVAFAKLRTLIIEDIENSLAILIENKAHFDVVRKELSLIQKEHTYNQYESSNAHIRHIESKIRQTSLHDEFSEMVNKIIESFPSHCNWIVDKEYGLLLYADIPLQRTLKTWMEEEILPLLNEIWELTEGSSNGLRMLIYNLSMQLKSALSDKNKSTELSIENEQNAIIQLCRDVSTSERYINELKLLALTRAEEVLYLSTAFHKAQLFAENGRSSRFSRYFWQNNRLLDVAQNWFAAQWQKIVDIKKAYQKEKKLSISEKIVRCVLSRKGDAENSHYTSIFLTRGNVGEQFTVGREEDLAHAAKIVSQWRDGFRGALLVSGQRFAGKTLFAEMISAHCFQGHVLRLSAASQINYEGRKFDTKYDLNEALQFVNKYVDGQHTMILIDDLELWHDDLIPLSHNVEQLLRFVDLHSNHFFILVCLNNYTKAYLNNFFEVDRYFQAEINMDGISGSDIFKAISIRHRATHKKLKQGLDGKAGDAYIKRLVNKINRKAQGNIGEALARWAFSTYQVDEDAVENRSNSYIHLPKFLNADTGLLLATVLLYKRITEKRLRRLFGEAFTEHYAQVIRRLLHVGILVRQLDGWLEIETTIVNDLGFMLEQNGFIKYSQYSGPSTKY